MLSVRRNELDNRERSVVNSPAATTELTHAIEPKH
jgi:hypothetical protein